MKKIIIVLFLFILCACGAEKNVANSFPVKENLTLSVKIKDEKEYIMVDQYTPADEIDFLPYLEIETNEDADIELNWIGGPLCYATPTYEGLIGQTISLRGEESEGHSYVVSTLKEEHLQENREDTLLQEGFQSISIYVKATLNDETIEKRIDTQLLLVPEYKKDLIHSMDGLSIEEIQKNLTRSYLQKNAYNIGDRTETHPMSIFEKYGYVSNIRFENEWNY